MESSEKTPVHQLDEDESSLIFVQGGNEETFEHKEEGTQTEINSNSGSTEILYVRPVPIYVPNRNLTVHPKIFIVFKTVVQDRPPMTKGYLHSGAIERHLDFHAKRLGIEEATDAAESDCSWFSMSIRETNSVDDARRMKESSPSSLDALSDDDDDLTVDEKQDKNKSLTMDSPQLRYGRLEAAQKTQEIVQKFYGQMQQTPEL